GGAAHPLQRFERGAQFALGIGRLARGGPAPCRGIGGRVERSRRSDVCLLALGEGDGRLDLVLVRLGLLDADEFLLLAEGILHREERAVFLVGGRVLALLAFILGGRVRGWNGSRSHCRGTLAQGQRERGGEVFGLAVVVVAEVDRGQRRRCAGGSSEAGRAFGPRFRRRRSCGSAEEVGPGAGGF